MGWGCVFFVKLFFLQNSMELIELHGRLEKYRLEQTSFFFFYFWDIKSAVNPETIGGIQVSCTQSRPIGTDGSNSGVH